MSLIYEYAERKEKKALKEFVMSFLNAGTSLNEISQITGKSIKELEEILNS